MKLFLKRLFARLKHYHEHHREIAARTRSYLWTRCVTNTWAWLKRLSVMQGMLSGARFIRAWLKRHRFVRGFLLLSILLAFSYLFFWGLIRAVGLPAKRVATWTFVIVWFGHLAVAAGAGYAAWRLWPERDNGFVRYTIAHLHAAILDGLGAIVLLFLAVGVRFTWKFSLAFFSFALLRDIVRVPLIFYVIRGPGSNGGTGNEARSGELPPDFWQKEFRQAVRDTVKDELLKPE